MFARARLLVPIVLLMASTVVQAEAPPATAEPEGDALLRRAMERFRAEDYRAAAHDLERVHAADPNDADVTALLGIALYRAGWPDAAEPHLRAASYAASDEVRATAHIFLGLIERDRGATDAARAELGAAAGTSSPLLADAGRALLRRTGPRLLTLTLLVRPGFDSNVPLLPGTALAPAALTGRADGDVLLLAAAAVRPLRGIGFTVEESASYRQQFQLTDYSLFSNVLGARYTWLGQSDRVVARYGFELMTLGGHLYALGHLVQLGYRRSLIGTLGAVASYTFRHRDYLLDDYRPFTGPSHTGTAGLALGTDDALLEVELRAVGLREDAADSAWSATGAGASLLVRRRMGARVGLAWNGWVVHRSFDTPPGSDLGRDDWQLFGELSLTVDVNRHVGLLAAASVLRNLSNTPDFDYLKLTAHAGVAVGWAGP